MAKIAIIGAGLMGHGIAQVFALAGHDVAVFDTQKAALDVLHSKIIANLTAMKKDTSCVTRVTPHGVLGNAVRDADFVFEAGPENLELKRKIFAEVEAHAPEAALLASNTSVIQITKIMEPVRLKARALGTHWWNPPFLVPLVEVIYAQHTGDSAVEAMTALLKSVGKTPVTVKKDVPGFVGNRLQHALWREAMALVQNGVCDAQTVDIVVKSSFGRRLGVLGPLENADLVGLDLTLAIHEIVTPDLDVTPGPLPYLRELIVSGRLGMKTGEGFRSWTPQEQEALRSKVLNYLLSVDELLGQ